ncbi:AAA family ATPase [Streptomyces caniscabiei]|uniref:AAA family ATPase n=1 Tax=Streptomyces caniscabiei TaxID=2746961 RepID=UPI0029A5D959|nr:AAA family ATPase [Streptomyces caniscabiei]MDX2776338.1 AAA family ATPase [Streptomyces caniscabiei]
MKHHENVKIIAFVGLAGSGKSTAVDYLTQKGYPKVYFGGVILEEVKKRGLELTQANEQPIREELREKEGKDFVVKRIIEQIHNLIAAGQHRIVADGLYTWTEYKALKHEFPGELIVVAVTAPRHLRHHRLTQRPVRPLTEREADQRDWAEIENLEKGGPIAIADYFISNDRNLSYLHGQIDDILKNIKF